MTTARLLILKEIVKLEYDLEEASAAINHKKGPKDPVVPLKILRLRVNAINLDSSFVNEVPRVKFIKIGIAQLEQKIQSQKVSHQAPVKDKKANVHPIETVLPRFSDEDDNEFYLLEEAKRIFKKVELNLPVFKELIQNGLVVFRSTVIDLHVKNHDKVSLDQLKVQLMKFINPPQMVLFRDLFAQIENHLSGVNKKSMLFAKSRAELVASVRARKEEYTVVQEERTEAVNLAHRLLAELEKISQSFAEKKSTELLSIDVVPALLFAAKWLSYVLFSALVHKVKFTHEVPDILRILSLQKQEDKSGTAILMLNELKLNLDKAGQSKKIMNAAQLAAMAPAELKDTAATFFNSVLTKAKKKAELPAVVKKVAAAPG